jgi:hypothetical protein
MYRSIMSEPRSVLGIEAIPMGVSVTTTPIPMLCCAGSARRTWGTLRPADTVPEEVL